MKYIKVMADHCSTGLWDEDGANIDVPKFLSPDTAQALKDWCQLYEYNDDYLDLEDRKLPLFDMKSFAKQGYEIARMIKKDLPDYEIWYFDEYLSQSTANSAVYMIPFQV